ncbi:hypothetical protein [Brevundimonas sp.]|uniref:hypothetical protein n=1 Tax=Brevundimonas sp. TaxID=1871086 RepID=UPI003D6C841C
MSARRCIMAKLRSFILAAALLAFGATAAADPVPSPTRLFIPGADQPASLVLTSNSDTLRRYVLSAMRWDQGEDGKPILSQTDDVTIRPSELSLAPGERESVDVRFVSDLPTGERTYRIVIRPVSDGATPQDQIEIVPVIDLPVFIGMPEGPSRPSIEKVDIEAGALGVTVWNAGGSFVRPSRVTLIGYAASGVEVFRESWDGWYILAGGRRRYVADISLVLCTRAVQYAVALDAPEVGSAEALFDFDAKDCASLQPSNDGMSASPQV